MSTDPNADLIGKTFSIDGEDWTVESTAPWSHQYVYIEKPGEVPDTTTFTCRPAELVRQRLAG